ncbi:hypothetical protein BpHYR1_022187 [Brachionus plicatilis]|uniref:Uncharacterized protein n=1 Tax=Brachionus plicatilis TaxID=10195 RepID=A0A3M7PG33_BRAPC|nr:hypothetical protein BpHYR1_022187 [Brachionus plicatilis]
MPIQDHKTNKSIELNIFYVFDLNFSLIKNIDDSHILYKIHGSFLMFSLFNQTWQIFGHGFLATVLKNPLRNKKYKTQ